MARSRPSSVLSGAWAALGVLALTHAVGAPRVESREGKCKDPIDVNADSADVDYKNNTTKWNNVVISQCDIRVEARHASATGLNSASTRWTFDGDVSVNVEKRGQLRSNQAVVDVQNDQIAKATITGTPGSPAEFEQHNTETNITTRGHAGEIVYEVGPGTVLLRDNAWLSNGSTDVKGSTVTYDIREEKVRAASQPGGSERVHIRISPKQKPGADAQKKPPPTPPEGNGAVPGPTTPRAP
jgi:lipopolysaccharide transport protein LptA